MRYIVLSSAFVAWSILSLDLELGESLFKHMLSPSMLNGPIKELDAYISYIAEFAYLSDDDVKPLPTEILNYKLLYRVYGDRFGLRLEDEGGDRMSQKASVPDRHLEGVRCVESLIEFGLRQMRFYTLSRPEIEIYKLFRYRLAELAYNLSGDQQKRLWVSWMRTATNTEEKKHMFAACCEVQGVAESMRYKLKLYDKLIKQALDVQIDNGKSLNEQSHK